MMKVLITGFEPIWGIKKTPSGELAKLWGDGIPLVDSNAEVKSLILPQVFEKCTSIACTEIQAFEPDVVLMFGATQKNDPIRIERFAINVERSPMGDNTRIPVKDRPIINGGPSAYESNLPIHDLVAHLENNGISAKASYYAGTHCCNSLLYGVMNWIYQSKLQDKIFAGFIHVPFPNEFGVIEDEHWSTSSFSGIVNASISLVNGMLKFVNTKK